MALRRREAHVDHLEVLLDRPAKAAEQGHAAAGEAGAEHSDAEEAALRRQRADDPGAGGAVAAEVALGVVDDRHFVFLDLDCDRSVDAVHERMIGLTPLSRMQP